MKNYRNKEYDFLNAKIMYTKDIYKSEIRKLIKGKGYNPTIIAKNTFQIFFDHQRDIDNDLYEKLLDISTMESGPEFEMTEKEFNDFLKKM